VCVDNNRPEVAVTGHKRVSFSWPRVLFVSSLAPSASRERAVATHASQERRPTFGCGPDHVRRTLEVRWCNFPSSPRRLRQVDDERDPAPDDIIGATIERAASILGVSVQKVATWERIRLVAPRVHESVASRHVRIYGLSELVELRIVHDLTTRGQPVRVVRRIVEAHRSSTIPHPLRELRWATDAGMVYVGFEDGSWVGGRQPRQGVIPEVIDLDEIRASTRGAALRRLGTPGTVVVPSVGNRCSKARARQSTRSPLTTAGGSQIARSLRRSLI
jgi:DNA-binding transcriptional MerR regulator